MLRDEIFGDDLFEYTGKEYTDEYIDRHIIGQYPEIGEKCL
jgi:hypothetical protein